MDSREKKIATLCSYVPIEIIDAASLDFKRIIGGSGDITSQVRNIFPNYMCTFAASCLTELTENKDSYNGAVITNSCHPMEGVYESLKQLQNDIPVILLDVPKDDNKSSIAYFSTELKRFILKLEESFSVKITQEELLKSIKKYNKKKELRNQLDSLIKKKEISLTADEHMKLNDYYISNNENYDKLVKEIIASQNNREADDSRPRIMLSGNMSLPIEILDAIEEYDGNVVLCDTCNSYRSMPRFIDEDKEPVEALAGSYLKKPTCARHSNLKHRLHEFEKCLEEYSIDAVIFSIVKFCTDQTYWMVSVQKLLEEKNIPFLFMDLDYSINVSEQAQTRIQAFLEIL